jgi:hypothetical protein
MFQHEMSGTWQHHGNDDGQQQRNTTFFLASFEA